MIDAIIQDPSLIQITIVLILLITVAIWRQLHKAALVMVGVYLLYIVFIIVSTIPALEKPIEKNQFSSSEKLTAIQDEPTDGEIDTIIEEEVGNDELKIAPEELETSDDYTLSTQDVDVNDEARSNEIEKPISQIENVIKPEENITPIIVMSMEFGKELVNRELLGVDSVFFLSDERIYALSKIQNRSREKTLFHEWYHEGKLRSKISMEVGRSYNWRTWSYIEVRPNIVGNWEVFVSDSLGVNYDSLSFQVKATTIEQE